ncbi:hypothetical protein BJY01DRAFT_246986 [Aspergillus pseudoustus]|uniref:DUF1996 domain-containing protein n=1 Tax=Aspergillus pseudoustus TaxID=1810923 RepID=A0ABR4K3L5_9EURO
MRSLLSILAGASLASAWTELNHAPFMNKNIDAIVVPGTYTSHMHTFFGSDAITKVLPTSAELQKGCYTGDNPNDLSVYWVPTLYYVDGDTYTEVPIFKFSTYYTNSFSTAAIPQDFAMISGNASAKTQAEADNPYNDLEWFFEGSDEREADVAKMPTSTCDQHLQVNLVFPQCVNADDHGEYDFADESEKCPDGMVAIPQLRYRVLYDTKSVAPQGWSGAVPFLLSCSDTPGDGYCFHGDFINGWYEDAAENMLINGGGGYDDGQFIAGEHGDSAVEASCTATDQDPEKGTSDYLTSLEMMANDGGSVEDGADDLTESGSASQPPTATATPAATPVPGVTETASSTQTTVRSTSTQTIPTRRPSSSARPGYSNKQTCTSNSKRATGQKSKTEAAKRALKQALDALDVLEE